VVCIYAGRDIIIFIVKGLRKLLAAALLLNAPSEERKIDVPEHLCLCAAMSLSETVTY
jgi:hypothetical protein